MNFGGLVGALLPVFFVLALGYLAGKRNAFDADQAAGLSKLALGFALPASLFVSMTNIRRDLLFQQGRLVLALLLVHVGLFLVSWLLLRRVESLRGAASVICAVMISTSATPVFGIAVLQALLGDTSADAVGLVTLAINLVMPMALVFLEVESPGTGGPAGLSSRKARVLKGLQSGLKSPLLWSPPIRHCCCPGGPSNPEGRRKFVLNDRLRNIRCCRVHGRTDSCRTLLPSVESGAAWHARSHHPADCRPLRSAAPASCARPICS